MKIVIVGVGTMAMAAADVISKSNDFTLAGFIGNEEEGERLSRSQVYGDTPFLGDHSLMPRLKDNDIVGFVIAVGDNLVRETYYYEAINHGLAPVSAVSSRALIEEHVSIGNGVMVAAGVVLSHGVEIGDNVILDPQVLVDVSSSIHSHTYVYPGATICGNCEIGKGVVIGPGAVIEPAIKIGNYNKIGAGEIVKEDLKALYRTPAE